MTIARRCHFAIAVLGVVVLTPHGVGAQVHWDVGMQVGATERLTSDDPTAPVPTPGPSGEIHAHIAVLPMLRVGPYAAFDLSPARGTSSRQIYAAGLRAKVTPPWLTAPWHAWAFLGVGFADAYAPSYRAMSDVMVESRSTVMLELPVGVGIARKVHGPWELYAELAARIVVARASTRSVSSNGGGPVVPLVSNDLLAVSLSLGVSLAE